MIVTPTDMRALRVGLGLTPEEVATMHGCSVDTVISTERQRAQRVNRNLLALYLRLETAVSSFVDEVASNGHDVHILIGFFDDVWFPRTREFRAFGESIRVYVAALSRAALACEANWGNRPPIVAFREGRYRAFLGIPEGEPLPTPDRASLAAWAKAHAATYEITDPRIGVDHVAA